MNGDNMSNQKKFWIGFLGGLGPYALRVATILTNNFEPNLARSKLIPIIGWILGVSIFAAYGGIVSLLWDPREKRQWRLFLVGLAAPAMLFSMYANVQNGLPSKGRQSASAVSVTTLPTKKTTVSYVHLVVTSAHTQDSVPRASLIKEVAFGNTDKGPAAQLFNGLLAGLGISSANLKTTAVLIALTIVIFAFVGYLAAVRYRARATVQALEAELATLRARVPTRDVLPLSQKLQLSAPVLSGEDSFAKGLTALSEGKYQDAFNYFSQPIKGVSEAFLYRGIAAYRLERFQPAIRDFDVFLEANPEDNVRRATALVNKGMALGELQRGDEEIAVYDEVLKQFGDATEPQIRDQVAWALINKGVTLGTLNRPEEEISVYDEVVRRFGREPRMDDPVATALVNKGVALAGLKRYEEEMRMYDEVVNLFGSTKEPSVAEQVITALIYKAQTLDELNRHEDEIRIYDMIIVRFGESSDLALRRHVAKALLDKGITLDELGRRAEALIVYRDMIAKFSNANDSIIEGLVEDARAQIDSAASRVKELS